MNKYTIERDTRLDRTWRYLLYRNNAYLRGADTYIGARFALWRWIRSDNKGKRSVEVVYSKEC